MGKYGGAGGALNKKRYDSLHAQKRKGYMRPNHISGGAALRHGAFRGTAAPLWGRHSTKGPTQRSNGAANWSSYTSLKQTQNPARAAQLGCRKRTIRHLIQLERECSSHYRQLACPLYRRLRKLRLYYLEQTRRPDLRAK